MRPTLRLTLLKWVEGPWEAVRSTLRDDLDHLETALNRWSTQIALLDDLPAVTTVEATNVLPSVMLLRQTPEKAKTVDPIPTAFLMGDL